MISWMMPPMRSSTAAWAAGSFFSARAAYEVGLGVAVSGVLLRTCKNFLPAPSSRGVFGAQHKRMLEPMHARIPQTAPIAPAKPAKKPTIEKMELPHRCVQCVIRTQCMRIA